MDVPGEKDAHGTGHKVIASASAFGMTSEVAMAQLWSGSKMQGSFLCVCAVIPVPEAEGMLLFLAH